MKTIIVTGGAGFIGSNFVHYLLSYTRGYQIVVFDKLTYAGHLASLQTALADKRVHFVKGDISDPKAVAKLYRRFHPEKIFNFAAESHVDRSIDGPWDFVRTNLVGTFRLLEGARSFLAALTPQARRNFRFLHISTDEVYGSLGKSGSFKETTPYAPNSPYAATKAGADFLVRAYGETFAVPVILTNCSNNYGPYQFPEKLIPLTLLNAIEGKPLPIYGRGLNIRDWLYVEDHCEALWKAAVRGRVGEKYNVGGGAERTNLSVVKTLCGQLETLLPVKRNPALLKKGVSRYSDLMTFVKDRPGHDQRYAIDARKIRQELGWKPRHSFETGLKKTIQWYLNNQDWCDQVQRGKNVRRRLGSL